MKKSSQLSVTSLPWIIFVVPSLKYEGSVGVGEEENDFGMNSDDGITPKAISNNMHYLVNDLLGPYGIANLADPDTEYNGVTDNTATATTNGDQ